ncbi:hypothetical protein BRCON_2705 [Candidatus Sumerlaea chitinivorans]|uniref:Uncharacterized protein n=1 Tax=Sumerlaea chitinivorans TaxID=2250252 RepID=A0A2Z4Y864_SUMC1|nr:hypothetical protein BRCON_2705 [Candidatus Sumerlaea chitinivorans]
MATAGSLSTSAPHIADSPRLGQRFERVYYGWVMANLSVVEEERNALRSLVIATRPFHSIARTPFSLLEDSERPVSS